MCSKRIDKRPYKGLTITLITALTAWFSLLSMPAAWASPGPFFTIEVNDDAIYGGDWVGPVTIQIERSGAPFAAFFNIGVDPSGFFIQEFGSNAEPGGPLFDFQTWDKVTVTDSDTTTFKELLLTPLEVTYFDPYTDVISGICTPSLGDVRVSQGEAQNTVTCDPSGTFIAINPFDFHWFTYGNVNQTDLDGDQVSWSWHADNPPVVEGALSFGAVGGFGFQPDAVVTVTVKDSGGTTLTTDWTTTDEEGSFDFLNVGFDLVTGMRVFVTDGSHTKELLLDAISITGVDTHSDTVFGTAAPNMTFNVDLDITGYGVWFGQEVTSNWQGNWRADFGFFGYDLVVGSHVGANIGDDDGDQTAVDHSVTTREAIQGLKGDVDALVTSGELSPKNADSLNSKLNGALTSLDKGNIKGAKTNLNSFISSVRSYVKTGRLSLSSGQPLIDTARAIIASL